MPSAGQIAVLQFGNDNLWHYVFLTPSALSTFAFNTSVATPVLSPFVSSVTWSTLTGKPTFATVATSGAYSDLSGVPSIGTQMSVDSGWTANSTVGDKSATLASYSNGINGTMVTALNLVSAGTGTALSAGFDVLVTVVKQLAAVRTALVAAKIPNA